MDIEPAAWADEQLKIRVDKVLSRHCTPSEHRSYTPEQVAEAIGWKAGTLIREAAVTSGLDADLIQRHVFIQMAREALRLSQKPNDVALDFLAVANEHVEYLKTR